MIKKTFFLTHRKICYKLCELKNINNDMLLLYQGMIYIQSYLINKQWLKKPFVHQYVKKTPWKYVCIWVKRIIYTLLGQCTIEVSFLKSHEMLVSMLCAWPTAKREKIIFGLFRGILNHCCFKKLAVLKDGYPDTGAAYVIFKACFFNGMKETFKVPLITMSSYLTFRRLRKGYLVEWLA